MKKTIWDSLKPLLNVLKLEQVLRIKTGSELPGLQPLALELKHHHKRVWRMSCSRVRKRRMWR